MPAAGDAVKLTYQIGGSGAFAPATGNKITVTGLAFVTPKTVTIRITSVADPSRSKDYTVEIIRKADPAELTLNALTVNTGTVTPKDTDHYEVSVESNVTSVTITAVPDTEDYVKLTYQIGGSGAFAPATGNKITVTGLVPGTPKEVTIKVTSVADPSRNADYFVTVTRKSASSGPNSAGGSTSGSANNTNTGTVPSTASGNGASAPSVSNSGTASVSMQTSVQNGTANTVVNSATANRLVNEAVSNQSLNVVVELKITGTVTKTEVSLPASAISRIGSETEALLTVSTPVADVVIPNGALDTLSSSGGEVSVVTERRASTVMLTLSANGQDIGTIPGGLTLTVPADNAGPGTVAVLIHEDGARETIRKSVAEDGSVRIPLNGSAIVEIVDNSKAFADVSAENWASDAVAFASAHELFNGTSETTFSPELAMSRGMLATVLYNLEGSPEQSPTGAFSDVGNGDWYAESVSWAAENGIINGYGGGQFGPNDNITREQFAIMLLRYMGSPAAEQRVSSFADADQISDYAVQALSWATEKGILNGYGNGQLDPGGQATRAQAAQMLKNLMENT